MSNLDDLKKKAIETLGTIADVSVEAYKVAEEKTKVVARRAKLNTEIAREKALIRRRYAEIGKIYYEMRGDNPENECRKYCDDITAAFESIEAKRAEIAELKSKPASCDCDCDADSEPAPKDEEKKEENNENRDNW